MNPRILLIVSWVIFVISLTLPGISFVNGDGPTTSLGYEILLMGSTAILGGGLLEWIVWLANPIMLLAMILMKRTPNTAVKLSRAGCVLAVWFLFWKDILVSESGRTGPVTQEIGCYIWVLSIVVATIAIHLHRKMNGQTRPGVSQNKGEVFK